MLRSILKSIGLMLAGEEVRAALDREYRYRHHVSETRDWMSGSFPEVADAMLHVQTLAQGNPDLNNHSNPRYMTSKDCYTGIDQFRERMRNKYHRDDRGNTKMPLMDFTAEEGFDVIHKEAV